MNSSSPIVLITGCTPGGMGHAFALEFAAQNCRVIATARRLEVLESFVTSTTLTRDIEPGQIVGLALDVTNQSSIEKVANQIKERLGRLDILINNAGVGCVHPLIETDLNRIRNVYNTNVIGLISLIQAVVPMMIEQRSGKIINVGSVTSDATVPWSGIYSSSKAAVVHISEALRIELQPFGIQVCTVKPGSIATNISQSLLLNGPQDVLKPDTVYEKYLPSIIKRGTHISPKSTTPEAIAKAVVKMSLKSSIPVEFYFGRFAMLFYILSWLPFFVRRFVFGKLYDI